MKDLDTIGHNIRILYCNLVLHNLLCKLNDSKGLVRKGDIEPVWMDLF